MTNLHIFHDHLVAERSLVRSARAAHVQKPGGRPLALDWRDQHVLMLGGTRRGKSVTMELSARALIAAGGEGLTGIDPHGTFVRPLIEWLAHPANGQHHRVVHLVDPASHYSIGFNPLCPADDSWEACHDAASDLASVIESRFEASPEETPRLARLIYVAGMLCAAHGLTVIEVVELLSVGAHDLRRSLLQDFDNRIVRRELEDLCTLAQKSPREFLSVVESTKNRLVRWLGDRRLLRILGQKKGMQLRQVFDNRELVFLDLGSLNYADAALVGCIYTSMAFAAARRRPAMQSARHRIFLDEGESLITPAVARMTDQGSKWGLCIWSAIHRLGQLRQRGDFVADALFGNCAIWLIMGGLEEESARYVASNLYAGHVDLAQWKPGTERPTAVGQVRTILKNHSTAHQQSRTQSTSQSYLETWARADAFSTARMASGGATVGSGVSSGSVVVPPDTFLGSQSVASRSAGSNTSRASSSAWARVWTSATSWQFARARGSTTSESVSQGSAMAEGESEALATVYENLPTAQFTLEEQLFQLTGRLMNLPRRELIMRVEGQAPLHVRTIDRVPAFRDAEYKQVIVARYLAEMARRSRYAVANADIDRDNN
jgi:hypothetical protein